MTGQQAWNFQDLTGRRFGRLVVIEYLGRCPNTKWLCKCDCGVITSPDSCKLKSGRTKSCGCHKADMARKRTRHVVGIESCSKKIPEYESYNKIKGRCLRKTDPAFKDYGGRGIKICRRWLHGDGGMSGFSCFYLDMGVRPGPEYSIDRFPDNDGNYEPGNCRWATMQQQCNNRRSNRLVEVNGEKISVAEACRKLALSHEFINSRLQHGWTWERAITQPVRPWPRKRA